MRNAYCNKNIQFKKLLLPLRLKLLRKVPTTTTTSIFNISLLVSLVSRSVFFFFIPSRRSFHRQPKMKWKTFASSLWFKWSKINKINEPYPDASSFRQLKRETNVYDDAICFASSAKRKPSLCFFSLLLTHSFYYAARMKVEE